MNNLKEIIRLLKAVWPYILVFILLVTFAIIAFAIKIWIVKELIK